MCMCVCMCTLCHKQREVCGSCFSLYHVSPRDHTLVVRLSDRRRSPLSHLAICSDLHSHINSTLKGTVLSQVTKLLKWSCPKTMIGVEEWLSKNHLMFKPIFRQVCQNVAWGQVGSFEMFIPRRKIKEAINGKTLSYSLSACKPFIRMWTWPLSFPPPLCCGLRQPG